MSCHSHSRVVRRVLSLIADRPGEAVSVAALSRAAGVSERTLRNAFYDVYGISPKRYFIRQGLEQARTLLQRPDASRVTDVATACGFFELGRFATAYRHLFGESPSDTLRAATRIEQPCRT